VIDFDSLFRRDWVLTVAIAVVLVLVVVVVGWVAR